MADCIFCQIRDGQIPAEIVYSDARCLAFRDIHPAAPVHVLLIPTEHIETINDVGAEQAASIGALFVAAANVAQKLGVAQSGYRVVVNCNQDAGQQIFHLHAHLLGGRPLSWPPG